MNILAHVLLAGTDAELRLGGAMGDFIRGTPGDHLPSRVRDGIRLHRAIDTFTDSHAEVSAARARFPAPLRRYAGILLDMWFDHCLARRFAAWSTWPLGEFSTQLREELHANEPLLPPGLIRFLSYMDDNDLPAAYAHPDAIAKALQGISHRLTRANPVGDAMPLLCADGDALDDTFERFFPSLCAFAATWIDAHPASAAHHLT